MATFDLTSLPKVDAVEIYYIACHWLSEVDLRSVPSVRLLGHDAERVAALWRALPPGSQSRCHVPPFAIRLFAKDELLCEASICWKCDNIHGRAGNTEFGLEFDGSHPTSRELLRECEAATGISATDENSGSP